MTFLIMSCSASDIFAFVAFLAGLVEWKDHPEFNLKIQNRHELLGVTIKLMRPLARQPIVSKYYYKAIRKNYIITKQFVDRLVALNESS